jgi:hypothetical protein
MILFYNKDNGEIFATIDGRVHDDRHLNSHANNGLPVDKIGKFVIGWIEKGDQKIAYNLNQMEMMIRFEDITPESPLEYRIDLEKNELIKK